MLKNSKNKFCFVALITTFLTSCATPHLDQPFVLPYLDVPLELAKITSDVFTKCAKDNKLDLNVYHSGKKRLEFSFEIKIEANAPEIHSVWLSTDPFENKTNEILKKCSKNLMESAGKFYKEYLTKHSNGLDHILGDTLVYQGQLPLEMKIRSKKDKDFIFNIGRTEK